MGTGQGTDRGRAGGVATAILLAGGASDALNRGTSMLCLPPRFTGEAVGGPPPQLQLVRVCLNARSAHRWGKMSE